MKKYGLLLVLILPMVTGCNNINVKKPKFAKYGNELDEEKFEEALEKALEESDFGREDLLNSGVAKIEKSSVDSTIIKRNRKEISKEVYSDKSSEKYEVDMKNLRATSKGSYKSTTSADLGYGSYTVTEKESSEEIYESYRYEGESYLVHANLKTKEIHGDSKLSSNNSLSDALDWRMKRNLDDVEYQDKKHFESPDYDYTYYKDGNVFTIVLNKDYVNENVMTGLYRDEVLAVKNGYKEGVWQLDVTPGKYTFKCYIYENIESRYVKEVENSYMTPIAIDDVEAHESKYSTEFTYSYKSVKVKEVDLSDYTCMISTK